jgi:hypothetical protein
VDQDLYVLLSVSTVLTFVGTLCWFVIKQASANRRQILRRILEQVAGEFTPNSGLLSDEVVGHYQGRDLDLRVSTRPGAFPPRASYPLTARLWLHHAPSISLRIRHDRGLAAFEKSAGLVRDLEVAGGGKFDKTYLVEAPDAPAHGPLADAEVRRAVDELLFRWDMDEVRIKDGVLTVRGDSRRLGQNMLRGLLAELNVLAHAYDRRPALNVGVQERFFWIGGSDTAPRCPYCHDALETDVDVSSCGGCQTMIHSDCFAENAGCPILGCGGRGSHPMGPLNLKEG